MAALGLIAGAFVAMSAPAQAAPGDATIAATPNTGLNTTQLISVSGNAGPLSTDNNGAAPGGVPDTAYPFLYISMCRTPLTASSCDTDLGNGIASSTDTDPTTAPHVVRVQPDASGNWGPINFLARKTIVNGDGRFQCGTGANQCVIGSANAPRPADQSYTASLNLTFAAPSLSYATVGADGASTTVTGTNLQMQTLGTGDPTPTTQNIYVYQCAPPYNQASCEDTPGEYTTATVNKYGSFSQSVVVDRNFTSATNSYDCAVVTCVFATIKAPPGAPDNFSAAGMTSILVIPPTMSISSVTGQTVNTHARAGDTVNLTGATWSPSTAVTVALCDTGLTTCSTSQFASNTLVVDAAGALTGGAVVDASATGGARAIRVSQATGKTLSVTITILTAPTLSGSPNGGGANTAVGLSGTNWNPGSTVTLQGRAGAGNSGDAAVTVTATATGSLPGSASYTVVDAATTGILGSSGALSAPEVAFSFSGNSCDVPTGSSCSLNQNVTLTAQPGQLNQTQAGGLIDLGTFPLTGVVQNRTGAINQDVITDARGTSVGWTLNAKLTNLTNNGGSPTTNGTIPATNMAWTPACAVTSGGATPTTGSAPTLTNADQLFCSVPNLTGNGVFTANAGLNLTVPATADAGTYNAILTLTLS